MLIHMNCKPRSELGTNFSVNVLAKQMNESYVKNNSEVTRAYNHN